MSGHWVAAAKGVAGEIGKSAAAHDATESFVADGFDRLKQAGLFKALIPGELGGGDCSLTEICEVIRILGAACGSTALAFSMHTHQVAAAVWRLRHQQAPMADFLRRVAAENLVLVSSGSSDWLQSAGTAERTDGGFLITARKGFSSGCEAGDLLFTSAVYDDPEAGPTVLHFTVPLKADGVSIEKTWHTLGMRGTGSQDVVIDRIFVPEAAIAARRPQGKWHMLFHLVGMIAFAPIYSAYAGVADGARDRTLAMARGRRTDSGLVRLVGEMENAHTRMDLAWHDLVRLAEHGIPSPDTTSKVMIRRTLTGAAAIDTVTAAMEVAGGASFYQKAGLERAFRDVQGARFHPLQNEPQLMFTGRVALGLGLDEALV
jgi:alkylation response protein AidB-like acyl-CoA dehydrogenase